MNAVVSILGKKALGNLKKNNVNPNSDDIRYERVPVYNKKGKVISHKERERQVPEGLSQNDTKILKKVRRKAYRWDQGFRICCTRFRFGWSAIIGLIPLLGDIIEILMALSLVRAAGKIDGGLPKMLRARMMTNIMLDFGIGFIPLLGDVGDMFFRANTRNAWLLDAYLAEKSKALKEGQVRDPDSGSPHRVPVGELNSEASSGRLNEGGQHQQTLPPAPARTGGYLLAGRSKQPDLETGLVNAPSGNSGGSGQQGTKKPSKK